MTNRASMIAVCLLGALWAAPAVALDRQGTDVGLALGRHTVPLDYPGDVDSRYNQAVMSVIEREYPYLHGGLRLGISSLTQSGNPATEGLSLDGGTGGFVLRSRVPVAGRLGVKAETAYDYHHVSATPQDERVTISWFEFTAKAGVSLGVGPLSVTGGGLYRHIDGEQLVRNGLRSTEAFGGRAPFGGFLDLRYRVARDGWIGMSAELGSRNGAALVFVRRY